MKSVKLHWESDTVDGNGLAAPVNLGNGIDDTSCGSQDVVVQEGLAWPKWIQSAPW